MTQTNFTEELALITSQIEQLRAQNAYLQTEVGRLSASQEATTNSQPLPGGSRQTRRKLLKQMFALTAGAATAAALTSGVQEAKADAIGTVVGASTINYGLTAAPSGVAPFIASSSFQFGLIGVTSRTGMANAYSSAGVLGYGYNEIGVYGISYGGSALRGDSINGPGVIGLSGNNVGVLGDGKSWGVVGRSDDVGTGGKFRGVKAALVLEPSLATSIPTTGLHDRGEFVVTNESGDTTNLYFCIQGNDTGAGTWVRLNQPYTAGTNVTISPLNPDGTYTISAASSLVFLPSPVRIAASNNAGGSLPLLTSDGSGNSNTAFQSIQITGANIPANAKGIVGTLTGKGASKAGDLKLWATGTPAPTGNTLMLPALKSNGPGLDLASGVTIGLGTDGKVNLGYSNNVAGSTCGFALDIVAYTL